MEALYYCRGGGRREAPLCPECGGKGCTKTYDGNVIVVKNCEACGGTGLKESKKDE